MTTLSCFVLSSIHKYVHKSIRCLIYPSVSFHGFALAAPSLLLADAAAMGGVCWRGLWVKVCLSGPAERRSTWGVAFVIDRDDCGNSAI